MGLRPCNVRRMIHRHEQKMWSSQPGAMGGPWSLCEEERSGWSAILSNPILAQIPYLFMVWVAGSKGFRRSRTHCQSILRGNSEADSRIPGSQMASASVDHQEEGRQSCGFVLKNENSDHKPTGPFAPCFPLTMSHDNLRAVFCSSPFSCPSGYS